jgi:hypothetical protein
MARQCEVEVNDVIRYAQGSRAVEIEARTYGSVAINPTASLLPVEQTSGALVTYDVLLQIAVRVCREIDRECSVRDCIELTASGKALGVANRDRAEIESAALYGPISARLGNDHKIESNALEHRYFDCGYTVAGHSSQSLTAGRVLTNADNGISSNLLNFRFGHVLITRATRDATLLAGNITKLKPQSSGDVSMPRRSNPAKRGQSLKKLRWESDSHGR